MAKEIFKTATSSTISQALFHFNTTPLSTIPSLPSPFKISQTPNEQWIQLELQYSDFKEAFCKFNLIARTCDLMNYHPEIFNVYNKIVIKMFTSEGKNTVVTAKDLYAALYLNELQNSSVEQSHKKAIQKIDQLL